LGIEFSHGCREIAFCPVGYFNLSHPVYIMGTGMSVMTVDFTKAYKLITILIRSFKNFVVKMKYLGETKIIYIKDI